MAAAGQAESSSGGGVILVQPGVSRTYWLDDPIDNFRLRVVLFHDGPRPADPASTAAPLPPGGGAGSTASRSAAVTKPGGSSESLLPSRKSRRARRTTETAEALAEPADAAAESRELGSRANPHIQVFEWQQKVLGPSEVRKHRRAAERRSAVEAIGDGIRTLLGHGDAATAGFRDRSYAQRLAQLDAESMRISGQPFQGQMIHSMVHVDRFVNRADIKGQATTSDLERPSALAQEVFSGRMFERLQLAPSRPGVPSANLPASQVMHICADLGPDSDNDSDSDDDDAIGSGGGGAGGGLGLAVAGSGGGVSVGSRGVVVLCSLRAYANGRLDMTPGFSDEGRDLTADDADMDVDLDLAPRRDREQRWYRVAARGRHKGWRFRLENLAEKAVSEQERRAERAARTEELAARKNLAGVDFTPPPPAGPGPFTGGLVAHLFGEVVGAYGFQAGRLAVQYFVHANEAWTASHGSPLHGLSQSCRPKTVVGDDGVETIAHFGQLFELTFTRSGAHHAAESGGGGGGGNGTVIGAGGGGNGTCTGCSGVAGGEGSSAGAGGAGLGAAGAGSSAVGTLFLQVLSQDSFGRFMVEGYGYLSLMPEAGMRTHRVRTWRPVNSAHASLRRFFVHEGDEISDLRYMRVPSGTASRGLNKYGFSTETTGTVVVRVNTVTQGPVRVVAKAGGGTSRSPGAEARVRASMGGDVKSGMTKAERVRKKLEARAREREAAAQQQQAALQQRRESRAGLQGPGATSAARGDPSSPASAAGYPTTGSGGGDADEQREIRDAPKFPVRDGDEADVEQLSMRRSIERFRPGLQTTTNE